MGAALALTASCVACARSDAEPANPDGGGLAGDAGSAGTPTGVAGAASSAAGTPQVPGPGGAGGAASSGGSASGGGPLGGAQAGTASAGAAASGVSGGAAGGGQASTGCGVMDHPLSGSATIDVGGNSREYILKLPDAYSASTQYKLVFGWHWRGGKASDVANGTLGGGPYYGLEKASKGTTIFVAPNGLDSGWANTGGRDIMFLKAMLALFESKLCIDQSRIFSTGFSYGGMMSDAIGCDMADVFRAIAPMSGALYSGCSKTNTQPIAVWMSHGASDDIVPLADGKAALHAELIH